MVCETDFVVAWQESMGGNMTDDERKLKQQKAMSNPEIQNILTVRPTMAEPDHACDTDETLGCVAVCGQRAAQWPKCRISRIDMLISSVAGPNHAAGAG